ncbi:MAG TPA: hypothetical protein VFI18_01435 [Gaiellales bacterium]|nr:hypothetical protein [Gaiellales bacterium]
MRVITILATAVVAWAAAITTAGATADTQTIHFSDLVESDIISDCNGQGSFTETLVSDGVMHTTQLPDGTYHFTVTAQGTDTLVPSDPSLPTYTGHFAFWDGDNITKTTDISTFTESVNLKGTDGSQLHFAVVLHAAMGLDGDHPTVQFAHSHCIQR